jgi:hypothetical protein
MEKSDVYGFDAYGRAIKKGVFGIIGKLKKSVL